MLLKFGGLCTDFAFSRNDISHSWVEWLSIKIFYKWVVSCAWKFHWPKTNKCSATVSAPKKKGLYPLSHLWKQNTFIFGPSFSCLTVTQDFDFSIHACNACWPAHKDEMFCGWNLFWGCIALTLYVSGFGGLQVACWPLVPKFAESNPAKAIWFFRAKNYSACLPLEGK